MKLILSCREFAKIRKNISIDSLRSQKYYRGTLLSILIQKQIERVKRSYHRFLSKLDDIAKYWEKNKKIPELPGLTPTVRVRILLKALGYGKRRIKRILVNPKECDDDKLAYEIFNAVLKDYVYSPIAAELQQAKGKRGELILKNWLSSMEIKYCPEDSIRKIDSKCTPDFLLEDELLIGRRKIRWIESKSMFGDAKTHNFMFNKQYEKYYKNFGNGLIIYWFGHLRGLKNSTTGSFIHSYLRLNLLKMNAILTEKHCNRTRQNDVIVNVSDSDVNCSTKLKGLTNLDDLKNADNLISYSDKIISDLRVLFSLFSNGRLVIVYDNKREDLRNFLEKILKNFGFNVVVQS